MANGNQPIERARQLEMMTMEKQWRIMPIDRQQPVGQSTNVAWMDLESTERTHRHDWHKSPGLIDMPLRIVVRKSCVVCSQRDH